MRLRLLRAGLRLRPAGLGLGQGQGPLPLRRAAPAFFFFGAGLRRRRQKAEQADRGLLHPPSGGGGDLVLSLSSGLALLSRPLGSSSATKFSWPAAQHPLWAGLRRRRQKAEQADRGLVLRLSSGLGSALSLAPAPTWLCSLLCRGRWNKIPPTAVNQKDPGFGRFSRSSFEWRFSFFLNRAAYLNAAFWPT